MIPESQWDPVGANIIRLLPDPNVPGTNRYVSTPITRTRSDQFDVKIDHSYPDSLQIFGRYSFVDTSLFRPGPLPGLAEGSNNDAFGSSDNRSQGLAVGLTWIASPIPGWRLSIWLGKGQLLYDSAELSGSMDRGR